MDIRCISYIKEAYTPWEWHAELFEYAYALGLECFSTPDFDFTAVDFLESIHNPIYKIASFEITDINLIRYAASKGKPMIISTGVATPEDIELALKSMPGGEQSGYYSPEMLLRLIRLL